MLFWNFFFFCNKFSLLSKKVRGSKVPVVKVRFVREQRIFAKGSRGPLKKRANTLLRYIKIYILSNRLQNTPPFSTALNLYGINVQKLCDECNISIKKYFFEDLPLVLELWINKDLNFSFKLEIFRFNNLLQSIDTRNLLLYKKQFSFIIRRVLNSKEIKNYYLDRDLKEIIIRDFTLLDFWFFVYIFYVFYFYEKSSLKIFFSYSIEGNMRIFLSQLFSLTYYRFKQFKSSQI
jgi:hypothetical protein